jgi:thiosulfate dehydrogenase [quinone] large subunit
VLAILLILAWKVAGYIGLDYFLLPRIGTPWQAPEEMPPVGAQQRAST